MMKEQNIYPMTKIPETKKDKKRVTKHHIHCVCHTVVSLVKVSISKNKLQLLLFEIEVNIPKATIHRD